MGALSLAANCSTSSRASRQPSPPKIAIVFASSIIFASLLRFSSDGRKTGGREMVFTQTVESTSAAATSPGIEMTVGPFSMTAVVIAVLTIGRTCLGLTMRPV